MKYCASPEIKSAVGLIVILFSEIDTELPTPKFSTTVPATPALAILRVTLPVPALTC